MTEFEVEPRCLGEFYARVEGGEGMRSDCMGSGIGVSLGFGRDVSEGIKK